MKVTHDKESHIITIDDVDYAEDYVKSILAVDKGDIGSCFRLISIGGVIGKIRIIPASIFRLYRISSVKKIIFLILAMLSSIYLKEMPDLTILFLYAFFLYSAAGLVIKAIGSSSLLDD